MVPSRTPPKFTAPVPPPAGEPSREVMKMSTGEAAPIVGKDARTIERWVDDGKIRGGRPRDPLTGEPVHGSHRWVDAEHAVLYAVGSNRTHLIPEKWRHLIPSDGLLPAQRTSPEPSHAR